MSYLHDLQARAADLDRSIADPGDQHGSLLNGLESGLRELRQRLTEAKAVNDRLARENVELKSIVEQLLGRLETKPAESLHDKLAALDGQLYGLLELSGGQTSANGSPEVETPVNETPVAADENRRAEGGGARDGDVEGSGAEGSGAEGSGSFEDIHERMRSLSDQLLSPIAISADSSVSVPAPEAAPESTPEPAPEPTPESAPEPTPEPTPEPAPEPAIESIPHPDAGAPPKPPRAFERPIKALAEKARSVLPKTHLRFDAETGYALGILRRIKGSHQPFSAEEVRELINGKFGLTLTRRDDAQLSASLDNQDGVARDPQSGPGTLSWRFDMG
jgi:outer membrane biosynthesis protein TonB